MNRLLIVAEVSGLHSKLTPQQTKGTADSCPPFLLFAVEAGDLRYYKQSVHTTPLPAGERLGVGLLHIIKLRKHLYAVLMVAHATCLSAAVHGEDGIAHVYTTQWD